MCCGQKRGELSIARPQTNATLRVRYSGQPQVYVRGPVTGNLYPFSPQEPVQAVDNRDATSLLSSRYFRLSQ
jgi:hypothetical protein